MVSFSLAMIVVFNHSVLVWFTRPNTSRRPTEFLQFYILYLILFYFPPAVLERPPVVLAVPVFPRFSRASALAVVVRGLPLLLDAQRV